MNGGLANRPLLCAVLLLPAGEDVACSKVVCIFVICESGSFVCRALGCVFLFVVVYFFLPFRHTRI